MPCRHVLIVRAGTHWFSVLFGDDRTYIRKFVYRRLVGRKNCGSGNTMGCHTNSPGSITGQSNSFCNDVVGHTIKVPG